MSWWKLLDSLVFTTAEGCRVHPDNFRNRVFYALLNAAKLRRLPPHAMRHTYASLLIETGAPLKYVQDQLGHSSIQITADLYGHLEPGANKGWTDRLDQVSE